MNTPSPSSEDHATQPGPRAFATATGFVFQIVGGLLSVGGCCLWSFSGWFQTPLEAPVESPGAYLENLPGTLAMVGMVATFLGGFGLLAAGLGLQGEHPRSGTVAMIVTGVLAAVWWLCTVALLFAGGGLVQILVAVLLAAGSTVLFLLAGSSARVLRLHPPPDDRNAVPEEFLDGRRGPRDS